jgi:ribose transport system ATP-binding protein
LTENRKLAGLALRLSMEENLYGAITHVLSKGGIFSKSRGKKQLHGIAEDLQIYPLEMDRMTSNFSGGNQQKILLGKWLAAGSRLLILDEPTRGVDINAKMIIHDTIVRLTEQGHTVILISSDLPELTGLSDRAIIMREGRMIGEISGDNISEDALLLAANGEGMMKNA